MDHNRHVRLTTSELTAEIFADSTIYGPADEEIGSVAHLRGSGPAAQVVIDDGGFLGIGAKPVGVPIAGLEFMRDEDGHGHAVTDWTKEQLKAMPERHNRQQAAEKAEVTANTRNQRNKRNK